MVICGLPLGKADPDEVPNNLITERIPIGDLTMWFTEWGTAPSRRHDPRRILGDSALRRRELLVRAAAADG